MTETRPLVVSSIDEDPATLRERFQHWGYLYFRNYVAQQKCQALLREFLQQLDPHVVVSAETGLPALQGEPFFETDPIWDEVYPKIQSLESFHAFFHDAPIHELMTTVTGTDEVFVYPMKMARISTPRRVGYETPPHQDAHSHHAGPTMAGIWIALHDISAEMGRLQLLPQSHKGGVRRVLQAQGVGGVQCEIFPDEKIWHVSDVAQGDVIIFHSCMVHRAEPNLSAQTVRLSVDTRFCDYGAPVFITNIEPHHGWRIPGLNWERIYRNWREQSLQHYWAGYPGLFSEYGKYAQNG
jgi:ectoine hydroxylase-related dioxygenase (phytanoyl-CoA dioxygenase family)